MIDEVVLISPILFGIEEKHIVNLPYVKDFNENNIPTKARPIQMNSETIEFCKKEILDLLVKKLIKKSKSCYS